MAGVFFYFNNINIFGTCSLVSKQNYKATIIHRKLISEGIVSKIYSWHKDGFYITTDKAQLDVESIHKYLVRSTWAKGIDKQIVKGSIAQSLCFGLFYETKQVGFARFITDNYTFGYLCDFYVLEEWRGKKLSSWLMKCCHEHPSIKRLRRILLVTSTAGWLYEKHGYSPVNRVDFVWQIFRPDIYKNF